VSFELDPASTTTTHWDWLLFGCLAAQRHTIGVNFSNLGSNRNPHSGDKHLSQAFSGINVGQVRWDRCKLHTLLLLIESWCIL
jgi:hypothetical protein